MDLLHFIASNWIAAPLMAITAVGVVGAVFGPALRRTPVRGLAGPTAPALAALAVFAIAAAGTLAAARSLVHRTFEPTELGFVRAPAVDLDAIAHTASDVVGLQALAATCLLVLVPAAVFGVWRTRPPGTSILARVAPSVAALAMALPVAAAAIGILVVLGRMTAPLPVVEMTWEAWNAVEVARWATLGVGATALMAATPIVVEAASHGTVIGRRAYAASQLLFVVGFGAWTLTRFCAEDVRRGPIAEIADGDVTALGGPPTTGVAATDLHTIDLPRGAWCDVSDLDLQRELAVPLALTHSLEGRYDDTRFVGLASWRAHAKRSLREADGRTPVLVAAIDRRVTASAFAPYLDAAQALGIDDVAILTFTDDRHRTLTMGEVYTRRSCVLVRTSVTQAQNYALPDIWWGSLSRHVTEDALRR